MLNRIQSILEMIRFSHTLFALPFALLAAVMAWTLGAKEEPARPFRIQDLAGILLCMATARSAAMAFNRIVDRQSDALNPRTAGRHMPAGKLSLQIVSLFTLLCCVGFVGSTLLFFPNRLPLYLSLPVLLFLLLYSYTKRFTALSHFWLGASLMLAPISAWIAIRGSVLINSPGDLGPAIFLGTAVMMWVAGFDMIYACQDAEFDRGAKLHSIPVAMGVAASLRLSAGCHLVMVGLLVALPMASPQLELGWIHYAGVGTIGLLLVYEHRLVRPDDLTRINIAFFNINVVISFGLLAFCTIDLLT